ncbi:MAG: amidohydrolase family protein [Oscillospiraceae bacterium]|nr:amidohydrolase family protein [Oscillospiraceae bacterium]
MFKKIFDSHTHIFPDKIAEKASNGIGEFYKMPILHAGTVEDLKSRFKENGVCGGIVCSVATIVAQVGTINDFIAQAVFESDGLFVGFCSLHPDMSESELEAEINRAVSLGLSGVKLHPDIQRFEADGKAAYKIYEVIGGRLPMLLHAGDSRYDFSSPKRIANALERFPEMTVIAAHLGGWSEWDDASLSLAGKWDNLYVDTASSLYALPPEEAREYIYAFGEERVLFGTDYPMWDIRVELERFEQLNLPESLMDKILYNNAKELLGL